jgi:hypothetical protein
MFVIGFCRLGQRFRIIAERRTEIAIRPTVTHIQPE